MSRYIPTGDVNAGGLGSVLICQDKRLNRTVAGKLIQAAGDHRRLLDELAALQRIRSKHVVEIFDVAYFPPGSRMGIVQEFVEGNDLRSRLGVIGDLHQFIRMLYQIATGIADIHAVGVIHRDIKPANMMVDAGGILKIIDFNLARQVDDAHTQGFVGTRGYAAPELYGVGNVTFSEKVDVYALAVTAYALLQGSTLPAPLLERPPRPASWRASGGGFSALHPSLDPELTRLLDSALHEDPALRPSAIEISSRAARIMLRGQHRALFTAENGTTHELDATKPHVTVQSGGRGKLTVSYDLLDIRVVAIEGEVWINNMKLVVGAGLPDCCVIALGAPHLPAWNRTFVTMDVSHPEVVL